MENKHIELTNIGDLQCDADGCGYTESVAAEDYTKYINKPCPKCGANLLTYEDYLRFITSLEAIKLINSMSEEELKEMAALAEISGKADEIAKMLEGFSMDEMLNVSVSTHNEIKIESIEKQNNEQNVQVSDTTTDAHSGVADNQNPLPTEGKGE